MGDPPAPAPWVSDHPSIVNDHFPKASAAFHTICTRQFQPGRFAFGDFFWGHLGLGITYLRCETALEELFKFLTRNQGPMIGRISFLIYIIYVMSKGGKKIIERKGI